MRILSQVEQRPPPVLLLFTYSVSLFIVSYAMVAYCHARAPEIRGAARDTVNAAWLLASLSCDQANAEAIPIPPSAGSRESTFDQIRTLSKSMGVKSDLRRLTYSELGALRRPSVVLLRHGPQATGYFAVVLSAEPGQVTTINAGWLTVVIYSEDEFRLRWTGHALVPQHKEQTSFRHAVPWFIVGFVVSLVLLPGIRWLRFLH